MPADDTEEDELIYNILINGEEDYLLDLIVPGFFAIAATVSIYLKRRF